MAALVDIPSPASPSPVDDSSTASSNRRPSLSISTEHAQATAAPPPTNDVVPQTRSSPSNERPPSGGGSSAGAGAGGLRSFSHTRSQSMSEQHHHHSPTSPPSAGGEGSSSTGGGGGGGAQGNATGDLVRRHHTLSTSSSRMGRLERSRARLALQGVGLSEEDQDFYIPPSPVRSGPVGGWSDVGHGGVSSYGAAPPTRHSLAVVGESHSRSASNSSAWGGSSEAASSLGAGAAASPQGEQHEQDQQQPTQALPTPVAAKRSSFVVLRGAKGDAALTQRRTEQPQQPAVGSPPRVESLAQRTSSPPNKELKHKNSLKPFLEAEASSAGGEEEWERSLKDERDKEEMELRRGEEEQYPREEPYSTPPLGSSYSSQGHSSFTHSRASTYQQTPSSADPWNAGDDSQGASVRRHQSLNSFRPAATASSESLSAASHEGGWGAHTRLASSEELLSTLSLGSVGFGRSRSGTSPAPLNLGNSHTTLSHSHSLNSHLPGHNPSGLHHSNSLGSHDRGALSPVGFPRSPWSPTYAETKQLGGISSVVGGTPPPGMGLNRGGSGSSRGSRISEEVSRMSEEMAQMELGVDGRPLGGKSPSPPGLDRENSVSPQPPQQGVGRSLSNNAPPTTNRRLPPLMTNLDTLQQQQQPQQHSQHPHQQPQAQQPLNNSFLSRQGPASASAYVPPIGHSHLPSSNSQLPASSQTQANYLPSIAEPNQHTARGNFTAVPGASSSDWHRQKEMLIGAGASSPFPSAVGVNPTGEAWPAGGGFGVGIAIQQQQQIQVLQNQMQQALSAMEVMRNQGAEIPAGFTAPGLRGAPNGFGAAAAFGAGTGLSPPPPIAGTQVNGAVDSPINIPTLIANKGYNPTVFDLRPANARFFVIKSYTEEDVHKSLKYEIWASTDLGNKRLDRAFRESADKGPIYLFFSVNASGHFAGMAQMLTPVDYQTSSNVWASDKWKGVLKVRWIYIKDVPLASLRHIRLSNTPENKPVTSSRDTQEVPYDAGLEVLRILSSYQSRTSLLQDLPWYEAKLSQGGAEKEDGEETPHPSHYARPTPSLQPGHQPHYAPRPPQSHSPAPFQPPPHHQQQQQQQHQGPPYLAPQAQYGMPIPTGPMGMGVGAPPHFAPMPQQQQQPMQMQNGGGGGGGRRFFNRNGGGGGGGGGGPQVF